MHTLKNIQHEDLQFALELIAQGRKKLPPVAQESVGRHFKIVIPRDFPMLWSAPKPEDPVYVPDYELEFEKVFWREQQLWFWKFSRFTNFYENY